MGAAGFDGCNQSKGDMMRRVSTCEHCGDPSIIAGKLCLECAAEIANHDTDCQCVPCRIQRPVTELMFYRLAELVVTNG